MNVIAALRALQHLFFPYICAGCGSDLLAHPQVICLHCTSTLPYTNFHLHQDNPLERIFWGRLPVAAATSYCWFSKGSPVQHLLHALKYKNHQQIGIHFGERLGEAMVRSTRFSNIEAIVPVPLHAIRQKERGYNQAALLATGMASALHVPVITDAIVRTTHTGSQTKEDRRQRWQNMENRFLVKDISMLGGKHLLLVDDVVTTGATLEACGLALLSAGGVTLSIATLAIAGK